jgi:hypothetical protein
VHFHSDEMDKSLHIHKARLKKQVIVVKAFDKFLQLPHQYFDALSATDGTSITEIAA